MNALIRVPLKILVQLRQFVMVKITEAHADVHLD